MNKLAIITSLLFTVAFSAHASTDCGAVGTKEEIIACLKELEKNKSTLINKLEEQTASVEELLEILQDL